MTNSPRRPPYRQSLPGHLLAAREAVMAPIRPVLRAAGLTEQQWRVLRVLTDEGPSDPSNLSVAALLYAPSVARILHDLAERKLVTRKTDPTDRRKRVIVITEQGRLLVERLAGRLMEILDQYAARFGRKRLHSLQEELGELIRCIGSADSYGMGYSGNFAGDVVPLEPGTQVKLKPVKSGRARSAG